MDPVPASAPLDLDAATRRLQAELEQLDAAITLVASGSAARVTLTSFSFGQQLVEQMRDEAASRGVELEAIFWPEDSGCDVIVRLPDA